MSGPKSIMPPPSDHISSLQMTTTKLKRIQRQPTSTIDIPVTAVPSIINPSPMRSVTYHSSQPLDTQTWVATFFLGFTFQPALGFSILGVFPVIPLIALSIQGTTENSAWMSSGWTLGGTVAFALAGRISDIFGRRYVLMLGQVVLIISYVSRLARCSLVILYSSTSQ